MHYVNQDVGYVWPIFAGKSINESDRVMLNVIKQWGSPFKPSTIGLPARRFDLDWLRVLAFGLLIFYHCGMLYVADWGYHIKSQYLSENLQSVMLLVNPWRMPILWMISGIAIRFVLAKVSLAHFISQRSYRLLLPLLFGILVIVPPQLYYEMTFNGDLNLSYWQFYQQFFQIDNPLFDNYRPGIYPHIDVNHLWYLRELWQFSLFLIALLPFFNSEVMTKTTEWLARRSGWLIALLVILPVLIIQVLMDDEKDALGFLFLCYGYLLGWQPLLWKKLKENALQLLFAGTVIYIALVFFYNLVWTNQTTPMSPLMQIVGVVIHSADRVIWVLAILGLAARFLNRSSTKLSYLTEAVYPYYIVHQSLIIIIGFELTSFELGPWLEPILVIGLTFIGSAAIFELVRRTELLRPLFGLKLLGTYSKSTRIAYSIVCTVVLLIFGLEILL
jgi:hypothetical protein